MRRFRSVSVALLGVSAVASVGLAGCSVDELSDLLAAPTSEVGAAGGAADEPLPDGDYYTVAGAAQRDYNPAPGEVGYCDSDSLGRAVCAYGLLTADTRADAKARGREDIDVDPAGWPSHNSKVNIPALTQIAGSTDYNGWMFNRSHLLADSLGGAPTVQNLVTGTRTQNVGSVNNTGGMAHTETQARDYLDGKAGADANSCPLYYAATPNYTGDELVPRTVTVDIQSCDSVINERAIISNTANGHTINYMNGEYS